MSKNMIARVILASVATFLLLGCTSRSESASGSEPRTGRTITSLGATVGLAEVPIISVNAGGDAAKGWFLDEASLVFFGYLTVTGGTAPPLSTAAVDTSRVYYPGPAAIYQSRRETNGADITYTFKQLQSNAPYLVRLHFADPESTTTNARTFNVAINGTTVLSNYDIFADAQNLTASSVGQNVAVVKPFNAVSSGTQLTVTVSKGVGNAIISGIDLLPGCVNTTQCGGALATAYLLSPGRVGAMVGAYQGDQFFDTGAGNIGFTGNAIDTTLVASPPPQDVLKTQRVFNTPLTTNTYTYTLPKLVAGQTYNVRLYFAELDTQKQSIGARKFDVLLNGVKVLSNFDAFEAGGKPFWASERSFEVAAESDGAGAGRIRTSFVRTVTGVDPIVNGIEVTPQLSYKFNVAGLASGPYQGDQSGYLTSSASADAGLSQVATGQTIVDSVTDAAVTAPLNAVYGIGTEAPNNALGYMTYTFPGLVPGKLYRMRLHFADIDPPDGGSCAGNRVFNVYVNSVLELENEDICALTGGPYRARQEDLSFAANSAGQVVLSLLNITGRAIINGVEVEPQPPIAGNTPGTGRYHVTAIGALSKPGGVAARDGGGSVRLTNGRVLWEFADTVISRDVPPFVFYRTGPSTISDPPNVGWWTNTAGTADVRTPWLLSEKLFCATDSSGSGSLCTSPDQPAATPTGQLVPFTQAQYDYNRANLNSWPCPDGTTFPSAACPKTNTFYETWPAGMLPRADGGVTVFVAPGVVNNPYEIPVVAANGVVIYDSPPITTTATNATIGTQTQLFDPDERLLVGGIPDGKPGQQFLYMVAGAGQFAELSQPIVAGNPITQLNLTAPTHHPVVKNETLELFDGYNRQIVTVAANAPPEAKTILVNSIKANFDFAGYPATGARIRGTATVLAMNVAKTQIDLDYPLNAALPGGYRLQLQTSPLAAPQNEVIVASSPTPCHTGDSINANALGATCIQVASFTPSVDYPAGSVVAYGALAHLGAGVTKGAAITSLTLNPTLAAAVKANQTLEILDGANRQEVIVSANANVNASTVQVQSVIANAAYNVGATINVVNTVVRSTFTPLGTLSAARSAGTNYTSITFTNAIPATLQPGQQLQFWANDNTTTQRVQVVTVTSVSGQTVNVTQFQPPSGTTYGVGTVVYQTAPVNTNTLLRRTANLFNSYYIARAPYDETASGYRNKASWSYWDQRQNSYAGGWVSPTGTPPTKATIDDAMAKATPMLYANGSISWNAPMGGTFNPYLNRYLAISSIGIGDNLYLSTAANPQGPWSAPTLISGGLSAPDPSQRDAFPGVSGADSSPRGVSSGFPYHNYYYAVGEHPEMRLDNGQTVYVSYVLGALGGSVQVVQIQLPPASEVP